MDVSGQFVPYKQATELVKLGMEFYSFGYYNKSILDGLWKTDVRIWDSCDDYMDAPLWQQAFDWFRTKHFLHCFISRLRDEFSYGVDSNNGDQIFWDKKENYEEARLACLDKLIELVKNKI